LLHVHPEARALVGRNGWSAVLVLLLAALQFGLAVGLAGAPWWVVLGAASALGAIVAHALGVLIHELAHDLVFRRPWLNRLFAILANVPLLFPSAIDFRGKHLAHHAHLGEPEGRDTQAPQEWERAFVTTRPRAFVWHAFAPLLAPRSKDAAFSWWPSANVAAHFAVLTPFALHFGWKPMLFLAASGWFAFGPHPVGIRRYGEHLTLAPGQPTTSYYGWLNRLSFNVGFHVEHHDLPSVPWSRLPRLRALAPELYSPLASLSSWGSLLWALLTRSSEGPWRYYQQPEGLAGPSSAPAGAQLGTASEG
jgi:sphingolipid delta-4 desaturase